MRSKFSSLLLVIGLAFAGLNGQTPAAPSVASGPDATTKPISGSAPEPLLELFSAHNLIIAKELRKKNLPDWAGVYRMGDQTLAVTKVAGFAWNIDAPGPLPLFTPTTLPQKYPEGAPLYFNYGGVEVIEGALALYPVENGAFSMQLAPARWGARRYLVAVSRLGAFAEIVNNGCEDNVSALSSFFLHETDKENPIGGRLEVATQFDSYFAVKIHPNVVAIKETRQAVIDQTDAVVTTVVVNAGSKAGLKEGMSLYHRMLGKGDSAIVKEVSEDKAEVEVIQKNRILDGPKPIDSAWQFTFSKCP